MSKETKQDLKDRIVRLEIEVANLKFQLQNPVYFNHRYEPTWFFPYWLNYPTYPFHTYSTCGTSDQTTFTVPGNQDAV